MVGLSFAFMYGMTSGCGDDSNKSSGDAAVRDAAADGARSDSAAADSGGSLCNATNVPSLTAVSIVTDGTFDHPVFVTQPPGSTDTLMVVEKKGLIRIVRGGSIVGTFLDLTGVVETTNDASDERGLLGLAFHPGYAANGRFYVRYTANVEAIGLADVIAERHRGSSADVADPASEQRLVETDSIEDNHNGGMLAFGDDGFLYASMGDGGGSNDQHGTIGNAQNLNVLLGKILRLDVNASAEEYAAAGNPFSSPEGLPQIWAYGLRNPWRFSFDRLTHDLYIGDVGQNAVEEIDIQPASSTGGENYGWRAYEGDRLREPALQNLVNPYSPPAFAMPQASDTAILRGACAITGGYVYRGTQIPALQGLYLFGASCSDDIAAFRWCGGSTISPPARVSGLRGLGNNLVSFGEDNSGNLYLVYHDSGAVLRVQ